MRTMTNNVTLLIAVCHYHLYDFTYSEVQTQWNLGHSALEHTINMINIRITLQLSTLCPGRIPRYTSADIQKKGQVSTTKETQSYYDSFLKESSHFHSKQVIFK